MPGLRASGSYLPAGVRPKDDSLSFNLGQAIYTGDIRIGPEVNMAARKKDHLDELIEKYVSNDPEQQAVSDEEIVNFQSAQLINDLRTKAGLTQRQLDKKVGTTASVICRMEQADYDGSLAMLRRITGALNRRLELRAVPINRPTRKSARA